MGGRQAAQKRYRKRNAERIKLRRRAEYERNKEAYKQRSAQYRRDNKEKVNAYNANWQRRERARCREQVVTGYGHKCTCCEVSETLFLEIHHPSGDGKTDRLRVGGNSLTFYKWLIAEEFPDTCQLLCANCHRAIHQSEDGICPHKRSPF